jgi:hypothetical protein
MQVIRATNVNDALKQGTELLRTVGVREDSRNGPVLRVQEPVCTVYSRPDQCVLFAPKRDANPFFSLVESLWYLGGRDDLKALTPYVKRMAEFSDDGGVTQPASYGKRWRDWFMDVGDDNGHFPSFDQLDWVVQRLRKDPADRRVVISMWDASADPHRADQGSKDVPCNLSIVPYVTGDRLNILVTCRSNDAILGAYGANAVQFGILLSYLAARLGLEVGEYRQVSVNLHQYESQKFEAEEWEDPYVTGRVEPYPIFKDFDQVAGLGDVHRERMIKQDLLILFEHGWREAATKARWPFIRQVAAPMMAAHEHWRAHKKRPGSYQEVIGILRHCAASDWRLAATQWMGRRYKEKTA